jgi:purine-binding chemotaxis protein CheW
MLAGVRHVVFRLQRDRYALPLAAVREVVVTPSGLTRVPRSPKALKGVMNLRGRVVPVIDLQALLQLEATQTQKATKIVLMELGRRELGLLITDVDGIESIEKVGAAARSAPTVRGLARLGALAITVLDPDGLDSAIALACTTR